MIETSARLIGLIADTHGHFRPAVREIFRNVDLILHAGDIGGKPVLESLGQIAPVVAVRGNTDRGDFGNALPLLEMVVTNGNLICLVHNIQEFDMKTAGCSVVVFGHSHRAVSYQRNGTLFINPGSAGPRRFKLPISVATLDLRITPPRVNTIFLDA